MTARFSVWFGASVLVVRATVTARFREWFGASLQPGGGGIIGQGRLAHAGFGPLSSGILRPPLLQKFDRMGVLACVYSKAGKFRMVDLYLLKLLSGARKSADSSQ